MNYRGDYVSFLYLFMILFNYTHVEVTFCVKTQFLYLLMKLFNNRGNFIYKKEIELIYL